jgi:hypothetical protein
MTSIILHGIAAVLWVLTSIIAGAFFVTAEKRAEDDKNLIRVFFVIWCMTAAIAFTLQVIA